MSQQTIKKSWGESEPFSLAKLERSLRRAGAPASVVKRVAARAKKTASSFDTTADIHRYVFTDLKKTNQPVAARYNLKRALLELGPTGFPFEQFIARLLEARGYTVRTNVLARGKCVRHEIDVLATKGNRRVYVEAKFHKSLGIKSEVQTALYMRARFEDIEAALSPEEKRLKNEVWLITNTQLTSYAITYAKCVGVEVMDWGYPRGLSLARLIDTTGLHPVTALTSLSLTQKRALTRRDIVLCSQVSGRSDALKSIGLSPKQAVIVMREAEAIINLESAL